MFLHLLVCEELSGFRSTVAGKQRSPALLGQTDNLYFRQLLSVTCNDMRVRILLTYFNLHMGKASNRANMLLHNFFQTFYIDLTNDKMYFMVLRSKKVNYKARFMWHDTYGVAKFKFSVKDNRAQKPIKGLNLIKKTACLLTMLYSIIVHINVNYLWKFKENSLYMSLAGPNKIWDINKDKSMVIIVPGYYRAWL